MYFIILALPYTGFGTPRLYHISLIFLSPFCIIGGITTSNVVSKLLKITWQQWSKEMAMKALSVFLMTFLLFNSGWAYEVTRDSPSSFSLSQKTLRNSTNLKDRANLFNSLNTFEYDVYSAYWFERNVNISAGLKVYVDVISANPLMSYGMIIKNYQRALLNSTSNIERHACIYLGYGNVVGNVAIAYRTGRQFFNTMVFNITELSPILADINKIYTNGGSEIYTGG